MKLIAIINVISWSGFWAFGFLALSADGFTETQIVTSALLAAAGLFTGLIAYLRLAQAAEQSGYAKESNQISAVDRNRAQQQGSI